MQPALAPGMTFPSMIANTPKSIRSGGSSLTQKVDLQESSGGERGGRKGRDIGRADVVEINDAANEEVDIKATPVFERIYKDPRNPLLILVFLERRHGRETFAIFVTNLFPGTVCYVII